MRRNALRQFRRPVKDIPVTLSRTKQKANGRTLVIGDTTELGFGRFPEIERVGPTGNGTGQGFSLHNALMVAADSQEILGVAGQTIRYRKKKKKSTKRPNASQRLKQKRESKVWGTMIDQVGPPAKGAQFIHVYDRGADSFEVYCHLLQQRGDWVIRASKMSRYVLVGDSEESMQLKDYVPQLKLPGRYPIRYVWQRNSPRRLFRRP